MYLIQFKANDQNLSNIYINQAITTRQLRHEVTADFVFTAGLEAPAAM